MCHFNSRNVIALVAEQKVDNGLHTADCLCVCLPPRAIHGFTFYIPSWRKYNFCTLYFTLTTLSQQKKHFSEQYLTKWLVMSEVLCLHCLFVVLAQLHCHWLRSALHLVPWIVLDVPDDTSILHIRHILHLHIYVSKLCATYVVAVITSPINGLQYSNYFLLN